MCKSDIQRDESHARMSYTCHPFRRLGVSCRGAGNPLVVDEDPIPSNVRNARPLELLSYIQGRFGSRAAFACSFGAEDMALLDMISRLEPTGDSRIRIFTLDTGRLFYETYDLMQAVWDRYRLPIEVYTPDRNEISDLVRNRGPNLFYRSPEYRRACCHVRKVAPLTKALEGAAVWITGLRRQQSEARGNVTVAQRDSQWGEIWKVNPLWNWTWEEVMDYVRAHEVPINSLHAQGFVSIGCAPCTRPVREGEDPRSGRWWWESGSKECGIHGDLEKDSPVSSRRETREIW
jgi:phosphoadenosine phosphosulfate reductase